MAIDFEIPPEAKAVRERVRTAAVFSYGAGGAPPPAAGARPVPMPAGPVRFAVAGHAECDTSCVDLALQGIGPDRSLAAAVRTAAGLAGTVLLAGRSRAAGAASGLALLAGSALQRFAVFEAGMASTKDPRYVVVPQRERGATSRGS